MTRFAARPAGPVSILGVPRSGTTWLGKIFDSHPGTQYRHEPDSGGMLREVPLHASPEPGGTEADHMRQFLVQLPNYRSVKVCGKLPLFRKRYMTGWRGLAHRTSVYAAKAVSSWAALPVVEPIDRRHDDPVPVWKSIESAGRAGLIAEAEPAGRVILIVRHPCGQIDSTLRGEAERRFTDDCPAADDWGIFRLLLETPQAQRRGLTMDMLRQTGPEERLAWRWLLFNEKAMEELRGRANTYVVRYEDLCFEPLTTSRTLFLFAGLQWDAAVEAFLATSTEGDDERYYSVRRDPGTAALSWRNHLDQDVIDCIERVVQGSAPGRLFEEDFGRPAVERT